MNTIKTYEDWWINKEDEWAYSACDNPECPEFLLLKAGHKRPTIPSYQNGHETLCEVCYEERARK